MQTHCTEIKNTLQKKCEIIEKLNNTKPDDKKNLLKKEYRDIIKLIESELQQSKMNKELNL